MNRLLEIARDRRFLAVVWTLAVPIALQNLLSSALNALDTLMIARLGEVEVAAVGLGNQVFFIYALICFGINTGSVAMMAQNWGRRDEVGVRKTMALALSFSTVVGLVITVLALTMPEALMRLLIKDAEVIKAGAIYLRMIALSYIPTALSFTLGASMRAVGNAKTPLIATLISVVVNTILNYAFIFGKLGMPALGVKGAALATVIARLVELGFLIMVIYQYPSVLRLQLSELFPLERDVIRYYFTIVAPVVINEFMWSTGQVMYNKAYALLGVESTAAVQVYSSVVNIAFVFARGLANACTVIVGQALGEGEPERAYDDAVKFLILSTLAGVVTGGLMILLASPIVSLFHLKFDVAHLAIRMLTVMGFAFFIRTCNSTLIVGVLRGGGDTRYSMFLEIAAIWLVGVPMAFFGAGILKLRIDWVVLMVSLEELTKCLIGLRRVRSRQWIKLHN